MPLSWNSTDDFQKYISEKLKTFLDLIDQFDSPPISEKIQSRKNAIEKCCEKLVSSIRLTLEGHPHEAYESLNSAILEILEEINTLSILLSPRDLGLMYRVRQTLDPKLKREDLFHIPFEIRHKVETHRYSIPGLPCLYLSGSLYTCWEEMGRPPFHTLHVAAFWVKDRPLRVLNFSYRPSTILNYIKSSSEMNKFPNDLLSSYIVLWPLIALSSIIVKHNNFPFKPEYIVPQMVLQWVTKKGLGFDGICYFSTHIKAILKKSCFHLPVCNFVFPAREIKPKGRCDHLRNIFKMTEPYSWQVLSSIQVGEDPGIMQPYFYIEFIDGIEEPYYVTEFGMVQMKLDKLVLKILGANQNGEFDLGDVIE